MTDNAALPPRREGDSADTDVLGLAYPYALDALTIGEERAIDARLTFGQSETRLAFHDLTRDVRETMALLSAAYSTAPPPELRRRILDGIDNIAQDSPPRSDDPRDGKSRRLRWLFLAATAAGVTAAAVSGFALTQLPNHLESKPSAVHSRLLDVA